MKTLILTLIFGLLSFNVYANHHIRSTNLSDICTTHTDVYRHVSESLKGRVYSRDNVSGGNHTGICSGDEGCEVDHRVSLELGGSNDISNLMIQPYDGQCNAHQKDVLENRLHKLSCAKQIALVDAQKQIYNDWESAYKHYVNQKGCS